VGFLNFSEASNIDFTPLPAKEAIAFFKQKTRGSRFSFDWQDVERAEHAAAFVVAKAMRKDVLETLYTDLDRILSEGGTLQDFKNNVRPALQKAGWWGRQALADPVTGETKTVQLGSDRRLRTIYETNLRSARSAGRWERIQRRKGNAPYLIYVHAGDGNVRHQHRQWGDAPIILPVDHVFWRTHYPPNGWGCRCIVRQVSKKWLDRRGLKPSSESQLAAARWNRTQPYTNPRTGETRNVPIGISPGFDYNVGEARLRPLSPVANGGQIGLGRGVASLIVRRSDQLDEPLPPARPIDPSLILPDDAPREDAVEAFIERLGGGPLFFDKVQVPILVTDDFFKDSRGNFKDDKRGRRSLIPAMAEAMRDPDEIWYSVEVGRDGVTRTVRRYLARFVVEGQSQPLIVIAEEGADSWRGVTAFPSDQRGQNIANNVRIGTRIYRRK